MHKKFPKNTHHFNIRHKYPSLYYLILIIEYPKNINFLYLGEYKLGFLKSQSLNLIIHFS